MFWPTRPAARRNRNSVAQTAACGASKKIANTHPQTRVHKAICFTTKPRATSRGVALLLFFTLETEYGKGYVAMSLISALEMFMRRRSCRHVPLLHCGGLSWAVGQSAGFSQKGSKRQTQWAVCKHSPMGNADSGVSRMHASGRGTAMGAYRALCGKLAVLHHREFGKFRRLKGRH